MSDPVKNGWWNQLYDPYLAEVLLVRKSVQETQQTLSFLREVLRLKEGQRVFDQCCGIGSLSIPLAQEGYSLVGIDQADNYIQRARAENSSERAQFICADALEYICQPRCQAAFNWWTSFGYFPEDSHNLKMLVRAYDSLDSGAYFALDYINTPNLYQNFKPTVVTERETSLGKITLTRNSSLDVAQGLIYKTWNYQLPDGKSQEHRSRVKLYAPDRVAQLLNEAGFRELVAFGDTSFNSLELGSPRCIWVGKKP